MWEPVRVEGTRDQKTSAVAGQQRGRVNRGQLLTVGVTDNMIESMLAGGGLIPRLRGVYAVGHAAPTEFDRETEALLSSSSPAFLSHISAALLWGLRRPSTPDEPVDERRLRDLLTQANIPPDAMNTDLHGYVPDLMWRGAKLIVEVDSWTFHRQRTRFEGDRRKDVELAKFGWLTLRITPRRIRDEPYAVVAEIAMMLGRRLEELAA